MTPSLPPLAIYVHIPWCVRKCPYCDFNSHALNNGSLPEVAFLARLTEDIRQDAPLAQGRRAGSVFFGGGTPSLLSADAVSHIIHLLRNEVGLTSDAEITLEANPGTFEADKFAGFRASGVNRLSLGVQSFHNEQLQRLGRIHSSEDAIRAIKTARNVGFENFNIDLMHGLPKQTPEQALADLDHAMDLQPTHLSWYQLTIEQNTEFYRHPPTLPEDEQLWEIQQQGQQRLAERGFAQYEVSAFAQGEHYSQHNLNYWRYGDYLGIGPGAHGKNTTITNGVEITRSRKTRLPKDYLNNQRPLVRIEEPIAIKDRPFDYFVNTLRLRETVSLTQFERSTGLMIRDIEPVLAEAEKHGWLIRNGDLLSTTESGYLYLNEVLSLWLGDA
ncbi:MAG: radical SAM family heme chaperone HemW [Reinekea sp.]